MYTINPPLTLLTHYGALPGPHLGQHVDQAGGDAVPAVPGAVQSLAQLVEDHSLSSAQPPASLHLVTSEDFTIETTENLDDVPLFHCIAVHWTTIGSFFCLKQIDLWTLYLSQGTTMFTKGLY